MNPMIREKTFYRTFFALALSLALQNLLTYSVNMMDTVMLGRYSQDAMSGVSLCDQVQFLLQMLVEGAGEGAVVLGSQYLGKNKLEPISHIIGAALRFGGALAVVMFVFVLLAPGQLLGLLSNEPRVIAEGVRYFQIICFSYIIFTVTRILVASLRSIGIVKTGYVISFSTLCINVSLNYLLIYGNLGCPELGVQGAAIATLVSRCVELLIVVYYLKFREKRLCLTVKKLLRMDTSYIRDYLHVSSPVLVNQALWGVAQMVQTGILGHLGGRRDGGQRHCGAGLSGALRGVLRRGVCVGHRGGADHRRGKAGGAEAPGAHPGGAVYGAGTGCGPCHLPAAYAHPGGVRRQPDGAGLRAVHAVHGGHGGDHGGNLLPDGLRQRHHPGRRRHGLQRQDEPDQHVADCGALFRHGGLLVELAAGGGVFPAEMGSAL